MKQEYIHLCHILYTVQCNGAAVMPPCSRHSPYPISINMHTSASSLYEVWILSFLNSICKPNRAQLGIGPLNIYQLLTLRMTAACNQAPYAMTTVPTLVLCVHFHGNLFICSTVFSWQTARRGTLPLIRRCCARHTEVPLKSFVPKFSPNSLKVKKIKNWRSVSDQSLRLYHQGHILCSDIITFHSILSKVMSDCSIDKRREIEEEKESFSVSSLSEQACRVQHKGALFIGRSGTLLLFKTQREKSILCECRPSALTPVHPSSLVISIWEWRVLFSPGLAPCLSALLYVCTARLLQQMESMYFALWELSLSGALYCTWIIKMWWAGEAY